MNRIYRMTIGQQVKALRAALTLEELLILRDGLMADLEERKKYRAPVTKRNARQDEADALQDLKDRIAVVKGAIEEIERAIRAKDKG